MTDDEKEPNQEPIVLAPIPPYEYPPVARSSPGDQKPIRQAAPYLRPPDQKVKMSEPSPLFRPVERQEAPEQPRQQVTMTHPETVSLPPAQDRFNDAVQPIAEQPKSSTAIEEKELTAVKQKPLTQPSEKINGNLTKQPQSVNFPENAPLNFSGPKLPKKLQYHGRKGRQRTNEQVVELLTYVQMKGSWPHGVSDQMQRYYRRAYPKYFRKGSKKGKIPTTRSTPINLQARRSGSGN